MCWFLVVIAWSRADGVSIQLDAGMHPAKEGFSSLPFFDEFDLSTVDILLISQYVRYTFNPPYPLFFIPMQQQESRRGWQRHQSGRH